MKKVIVIGGGLAGLTAAIQMARCGVNCTVVEKKTYPFHRVCGEYISNEVVPFLESAGLLPSQFAPPQINRFQLSSVRGKSSVLPLDVGGFGISRYTFDHFLYERALKSGVDFFTGREVQSVTFQNNTFSVSLSSETLHADVVIGAFGKRSKIDVSLRRKFILKRSPYVGVKYHIRTDHPDDLIALHNFPGGYCGISNVENGISNVCYLVHRDYLRRHKTIGDLEQKVLYINPFLKHIFRNAEFLFEKPETINEISFETKSAVEDHILMAGDAAGMIAPLCGNGMAMAIHSGKLIGDLVSAYCLDGSMRREEMEQVYSREWQKLFARRLWIGRNVQRLFGSEFASAIAINLALHVKPLAKLIIRNTHGDVF